MLNVSLGGCRMVASICYCVAERQTEIWGQQKCLDIIIVAKPARRSRVEGSIAHLARPATHRAEAREPLK